MAVPQRKQEWMSEDDYLMYERQASERHEFEQGECVAMAGGTRWHNRLAGRIFSALLHHLDGKACTPYIADMRLYIESYRHYVYPDVLVVCDEEAYIADDMVNDATVIIEVLSPGTEAYDRGRKFLHYQKLPSLREYLIISQEIRQVELFRKNTRQKWEYELWDQPTDVIALVSIEFTMAVAALYQFLPLDQAKQSQGSQTMAEVSEDRG